jgi:hypothetical protein
MGDAIVRVLLSFAVGFSVFALMMASLLVISTQPIPAFFFAGVCVLAILSIGRWWAKRERLGTDSIAGYTQPETRFDFPHIDQRIKR